MRSLLALILVPFAFAHYTLDYPPTTGFDEDLEPNPPCGDFYPDLNNLTAFPLSGGDIAIDSHHPEMTILFRAQLMGSDSWVNLTNGFLLMTGLGELCLNALPVPGNWSGKVGVIQTIGQPPDGTLYQCAGVKWTAGAPGTSPLCVNGSVTVAPATSGFSISQDDVTFNGTATSTPSATGTTTPTSSSTGSSSSKSAGAINHVSGTFWGILCLTAYIITHILY